MADTVPEDDPDYTPGGINYDLWKSYFYATVDDAATNEDTLRMLYFSVSLSAGLDTPFEDGLTLYDDWDDWVQGWVTGKQGPSSKHYDDVKKETHDYVECPPALRDVFFTDDYIF